MSNPFGEDSITGYNSNPPPNDGSETVENTADWNLHVVAKIGDPIKNYAQANFSNVSSAITQLVGGAGITTVATSYAVTSADRGKLVNVNGGSGVTVTTPSAASVGSTFCFGLVNTSANAITLDGSGAQTVNGSATLTIPIGAAALLNTDGSNWFTYAAPGDPSRTSLFLTAQPMEASVADGNVVYYHVANAEWTKAQAGTTEDAGLGIADVTNGYVFGPGLVEMAFDQGALTTNADLYLSGSTAGEITSTRPERGVNLGRALSATQLWFNPQTPHPGEVVLIEAQTASASASLDFIVGFDGAYDDFTVIFDGILPATDDSELWMQVSYDGAAWQVAADSYRYLLTGSTSGGGVLSEISDSATEIVLTDRNATFAVSNVAARNGFCGKIEFSSPDSATEHLFRIQSTHANAAGTLSHATESASDKAGTAILGLRFIMETGNIASGTIRLYGVAK